MEPSTTPTLGERLLPILASGDILLAWELLEGLQPAELPAAKAWFRTAKRDTYELDLNYAGGDSSEQSETRRQANWVLALCAVRLCGPAEAARKVPWDSLDEGAGEAAFVHALWDANPIWVADFVTAASNLPTARLRASWSWEILGRVLRAVVIHHGLPCPSGAAFIGVWLAGVPGEGLVEQLRGNPLMPDLLWHRLAGGDCGSTPGLAESIAALVQLGELDRLDVLEHVLALLTAPQRPASQHALAQIARALELAPDEIPGGLNYLMGVIGTSHGSVGKLMVPHAIALVQDGEQLIELATVLAGRPEKRQKELLLTALNAPALADRATPGAAVAAASLFIESDDASLAARARKLVERLGGAVEPAGPVSVATGLWELEPSSAGPPNVGMWRDVDWGLILIPKPDFGGGPTHEEMAFMVAQTLHTMREGRFDGDDLVSTARRLSADSQLSVSRLARLVPDLFLGGGLRQSWSATMAVAELSSEAAQRPAGLANLLAALGAFAAEVPNQELPMHLRELARSSGNAKMQVEARLLGARLLGLAVPDYVRRLRNEHPEPEVIPQQPFRGLWSVMVDPVPLPSQLRVGSPPADLVELRKAVAQDFYHWTQDVSVAFVGQDEYSQTTSSADLAQPDQVLAGTVRAIHRHGPDAVRTALAGISREVIKESRWGKERSILHPVGIVFAVDLWVKGRLDVDLLRAVAHHSETWGEARDRFRRAGVGPDASRAAVDRLPNIENGLAVDAEHLLVRPRPLDSGAASLSFLRAAESLLSAEANAEVLCVPTWADGTLDWVDLQERIVRADGLPTSPLDLVQALWRLRPGGLSLAGLEAVSLPLAFGYARADGAAVVDGMELVLAWVVKGGLPPLNAYDRDGLWQTDAAAPVTWSGCEHLPAQLAGDPWNWGEGIDALRIMPRWPDRLVCQPRGERPERDLPVLTGWELGLPILDLFWPSEDLLARCSPEASVELARQQRFDPDLFGQLALARHRGGSLHLGLLVPEFKRLFETPGCFLGVWPAALEIASSLVDEARKPAQLPQLLRLLTDFANEIPEPVVPARLREFAASRGATKSHVEARRLVEALDR